MQQHLQDEPKPPLTENTVGYLCRLPGSNTQTLVINQPALFRLQKSTSGLYRCFVGHRQGCYRQLQCQLVL